MSLHADLLDQAEQLAQLDPRRPKQANLRRSVSSAYYALFHSIRRARERLAITQQDVPAETLTDGTESESERRKPGKASKG